MYNLVIVLESGINDEYPLVTCLYAHIDRVHWLAVESTADPHIDPRYRVTIEELTTEQVHEYTQCLMKNAVLQTHVYRGGLGQSMLFAL